MRTPLSQQTSVLQTAWATIHLELLPWSLTSLPSLKKLFHSAPLGILTYTNFGLTLPSLNLFNLPPPLSLPSMPNTTLSCPTFLISMLPWQITQFLHILKTLGLLTKSLLLTGQSESARGYGDRVGWPVTDTISPSTLTATTICWLGPKAIGTQKLSLKIKIILRNCGLISIAFYTGLSQVLCLIVRIN